MPPPPHPLVTMTGITKRFPGAVALADVALALLPGEVHVLLGENGAGKSTLVGVLSGMLRPDAGSTDVSGRPEAIGSPDRALTLGIGTVFQHSMLVPSLSLVDNIALGGPWWRRPDRAGLSARMAAVCREIGIALDPGATVGLLSLGERQQAEIVRALMRGSRVLILDEPTAMLTPDGAAALGALLRRLAARGLAAVLITHKLDEALDFGDRITVLRRGRVAGTIGPNERAAFDREAATTAILRLMFGPAVPAAGAGELTDWQQDAERPFGNASAPHPEEAAPRPSRSTQGLTAPTLLARRLAVADPVSPLWDIDLAIGPGEILGLAGIDGQGQRQLAEALAGQRPLATGAIMLDGQAIQALSVAKRRGLGLRYVTDDRLDEGTVAALPVALNLVLKDIGAAPFWRRGVARPLAIAAHAARLIAAFDVRTPSVAAPLGTLSGGNIQKTVLARELTGPARVVIYAKPTYGLDVQTAAATHRRIRAAAGTGVATLLISTDLDELLALSHRIAVMAGGRIVGTVTNDGAARHRVGAMMSAAAA